MMMRWTVYKARSLLNGGAGLGLSKLGMVEADTWSAAIDKAQDTFAADADPALPQGGFTVVTAARPDA